MSEVRAAASAVTLALAGALLVGCGGADAEPEALPAGVEVSLVQQRSDVAARQAQVRVRNDGDTPVTLGAVEVADPRFDGVAVRVVDRTTTLAPGRGVDIRVQLPPVDCAGQDAATTTVAMEIEVGDTAYRAESDISDTLGFLLELYARECLADALAEVATVSIAGFTPAPTGQAGGLTLSIEPTGAGTARLEAVDSTPLLMYVAGAPPAPLPLGIDIGPGASATTVEIPLVPQRCDPHVVQEDKRGTIFTVDAVVGDVRGEIDIPAPPEMKARMLTWVAEWCGFGG
ncbi:hypothetical protein [Microbacterium lushaniae]|uniref:Lipoprotein n=1 Tax=Microbacterium lushaniae TaxID=2614639 RepID=A0A5J6L7R5_9MICO|nr:hypothetical protein [Microbacterium lushaniae]QEW04477.1 hypothetical protein F6J85_16240 [Microbacterium lushaniae]